MFAVHSEDQKLNQFHFLDIILIRNPMKCIVGCPSEKWMEVRDLPSIWFNPSLHKCLSLVHGSIARTVKWFNTNNMTNNLRQGKKLFYVGSTQLCKKYSYFEWVFWISIFTILDTINKGSMRNSHARFVYCKSEARYNDPRPNIFCQKEQRHIIGSKPLISYLSAKQ